MGAKASCCEAKADEENVTVQPQAVSSSGASEPAKSAQKTAPETEVPKVDDPPVWKLTVKKPADGSGIGMDVNTKRYRYKYVVIRHVVEGGELDKINATMSSEEKVKSGDRLLSANGVSGGKAIVGELKSASVLELEIQRVESEDPTSSD